MTPNNSDQRLSDIACVIDCEHKTAPTQETGYPSIRTPNIGRGRLILDGVNRVSQETYLRWTRRAVPHSHDLILAREAPVGNVAIIPEHLKVCLGQRTVLIQPDRSKVDSHYLTYLLLGDDLQSRFKSYSTGATVGHLNVKDIRDLLLPELPPINVQRKVATILCGYDDLIGNNLGRIKILEEMAEAVYREWFVKFRFPGHENVRMVDSSEGKIPEGWEVRRLADACGLVMGQSPKSEFYNDKEEGLPFHQGVTDYGDRFPVNRIYCTIKNRIAESGDILFSVRAPVGRINISSTRIVIGRGLAAIRPEYRKRWFIFHQLKELFKEEDIMGSGTIFKAVTKKDVQNIKLIWPPDELVCTFETRCTPMETQIENLTKRIRVLRSTRDLLLPRLISGELDVSGLDIATPEEAA